MVHLSQEETPPFTSYTTLTPAWEQGYLTPQSDSRRHFSVMSVSSFVGEACFHKALK